MQRRIRNMPSASMVVAFTALLLALGGTAVALPGSNTVTTDDIKNGHVRTQDIRNSTVRTQDVRNSTILGRDVRNNTLTGADVNEATLATVPRAITATGSDTANRASSAGSVDGRTPFLVKLAAGESTTIASNGAVSIVAECLTSGGNDTVRILGATTAGGAAQGGNNSFNGSAGNTLEPGTAAGSRVILSNSATSGTTEVSWNIDEGWVMAPDGKTLGIDGETTPLGVNYAGAKCVASGVVNAAG